MEQETCETDAGVYGLVQVEQSEKSKTGAIRNLNDAEEAKNCVSPPDNDKRYY